MRLLRTGALLATLGLLTVVPGRAQRSQPVTVVTGTLLGSDGVPMKLAHVLIWRGMSPRHASRSLVGGDGRYAIATQLTGPLFVEFTGVDHYAAAVPLLVERPGTIVLDVGLKRYAYSDSLARVMAIGDWNHFQLGAGKPLVRQPDGRYSAIVPVDSSVDTLAYELMGLEKSGRSINGSQPARYAFDNGGDYRSIIPAKDGRATIVVDPSQLDRRPSELTVTFGDSRSPEARLYALDHAWNTEDQAFVDSSRAARARHDSVHFAWGPILRRLRAALRSERRPLLRQLLLFQLVDATGLADSSDSAVCRSLLANVPDSSPWFSLLGGPNALHSLYRAYGVVYGTTAEHALSDAAQRQLLGRYERIAAEQPDSEVQASALENAVFLARALHDSQRFNADYAALVEGHRSSDWARVAQSEFAPTRPLREGVPMPEFRFASLEDSTVMYTPASFAGKVVLVDFWATWCGPCISEMKYLQATHDSLAAKGLGMLSVSLDNSAGDVVNFRRGEWKMPWLQAFAPGAFDNPWVKRLEILGIPTVVLVGRDGKIIAVDEGLRGEDLLPTVRLALEGNP